jgi:hypothetical protein
MLKAPGAKHRFVMEAPAPGGMLKYCNDAGDDSIRVALGSAWLTHLTAANVFRKVELPLFLRAESKERQIFRDRNRDAIAMFGR